MTGVDDDKYLGTISQFQDSCFPGAWMSPVWGYGGFDTRAGPLAFYHLIPNDHALVTPHNGYFKLSQNPLGYGPFDQDGMRPQWWDRRFGKGAEKPFYRHNKVRVTGWPATNWAGPMIGKSKKRKEQKKHALQKSFVQQVAHFDVVFGHMHDGADVEGCDAPHVKGFVGHKGGDSCFKCENGIFFLWVYEDSSLLTSIVSNELSS